ncbi:MAG: 50S ribosomal protein L10 [Candidatus Pacearchaeota archaeon]
MVNKKQDKTRESKGQEIKKKKVNEIQKLIKENNCIIIASIKSLPSKQFHAIKKELRDKGEVRVFKKSTILRALELSEKKNLQNLKNYIQENIAFIFSKLDPFELSAILSEKKSPVKAKTGQIAEEDIAIEPGPTEFVPGPIISELGALGIKIAVEEGKITVKERKVIVKKGEKISENAATIMAKFDIKPFFVGLIPLVAYDKINDKIYENIKVDKESTLKEFKELYNKTLAFAVKINYPCKETIKYLIMKALAHEKALEKFIKVENQVSSQQATNTLQLNSSQPAQQNT